MKIVYFGHEAQDCARELSGIYTEHEWIDLEESSQQDRATADILIGLAPHISADLINALPRLKWVHALTTGVDNLLEPGMLRPGIVVTNTSGIHGPQMAELALLFMLALPRQFPRMLRSQAEGNWDRFAQPLLENKRVCIIGVGNAGLRLAPICAAFGMKIDGVSDVHQTCDEFDRIYPPEDLTMAVADADFVVMLTPYTPSTHHLVSDPVLTAMKDSTYLINLSRGGCLDEDALLRHLNTGSIAGAGLDVFSQEPLPQDHPIWTVPNVIATPHVGGMSDIYSRQAMPVLVECLDRVRNGSLRDLKNMRPS